MDTFRDKAGEPIGTDIDNWVASFTRMESGSSELPPHHPNCLGCGPENPNGHFLSVRRDGDGVVAHHQFDQRHVGAPGIAHGGAVATVIDDLFGFLLYSVGELAVTRRLELEYLAPALLDTPYILRVQFGLAMAGNWTSSPRWRMQRAALLLLPLPCSSWSRLNTFCSHRETRGLRPNSPPRAPGPNTSRVSAEPEAIERHAQRKGEAEGTVHCQLPCTSQPSGSATYDGTPSAGGRSSA